MNAAEQVNSFAYAHALASVATIVRQYFPEASANLTPWRDDPETQKWFEAETLDIAFHFPGWSPRLECRSLLIQLRIRSDQSEACPHLVGILMRGMTFDGERWRLATLGDWKPTGSYVPQLAEQAKLKGICRDLFALFTSARTAFEKFS